MKLAIILIVLAISCVALCDRDCDRGCHRDHDRDHDHDHDHDHHNDHDHHHYHDSSCKVCREPNTEFKLCDRSPRTCENLHSKLPCPPVCKPGCYCKKGYVRDTVNRRCVLPCDCPKPKPRCPHSHHPGPNYLHKKPCGCHKHSWPYSHEKH